MLPGHKKRHSLVRKGGKCVPEHSFPSKWHLCLFRAKRVQKTQKIDFSRPSRCRHFYPVAAPKCHHLTHLLCYGSHLRRIPVRRYAPILSRLRTLPPSPLAESFIFAFRVSSRAQRAIRPAKDAISGVITPGEHLFLSGSAREHYGTQGVMTHFGGQRGQNAKK